MTTPEPTHPASQLRDAGIGIIRTVVPAVVANGLAYLAGVGIVIDEAGQAQLSLGVMAVVTAIYYAAFTLLERKASPLFGWFLGWAKAPTYVPPTGTGAPAGEDVADVVDLPSGPSGPRTI